MGSPSGVVWCGSPDIEHSFFDPAAEIVSSGEVHEVVGLASDTRIRLLTTFEREGERGVGKHCN